MNNDRLAYLIDKYLQKQCLPSELEELEAWYHSLNLMHIPIEETGLPAEIFASEMLLQFKQQFAETGSLPVRKLPPFQWISRFAAVLAGVMVIAGAAYFFLRAGHNSIKQQVIVKTDKTVRYTRTITLADGSTVVLHANSSLIYPETFTGDKREVTLSGEAYFDVKHTIDKPFIIYTGKVKTTVLGTAFNIKAYPGQKNVIVSVTRGKVKVEDSTRLLAVLIPDQQINYNLVNAKAEQYKVNANMVVTDWTKQDMLFDEISFASVVEILKKRYDVNIRFSKDALAKCLVRASFDGTERLEKVLTVLCKVLGDSYSIDGHTIVIEGEGCEDAAL